MSGTAGGFVFVAELADDDQRKEPLTVWRCTTCGCLVDSDSKVYHRIWHTQLEAALRGQS